jgi:multidrug resistance efflux pump
MMLHTSQSIEDTVEYYFTDQPRAGRVIYLVILAITLGALVALPFVKVGVTVQSAGVIRPEVERQSVRAAATGSVDRVQLRPNQQVRRGDTLVVLRDPTTEERLRQTRTEEAEGVGDVADLSRLVLVAGGSGQVPELRTARYRQAYTAYQSELARLSVNVERARLEVTRVSAMLARGFAAPQELEDRRMDLARAVAEQQAMVDRTLSEWQGALASTKLALLRTNSALQQGEYDLARTALVAPIDGTVTELRSLSPGSFVQAGEELALISPSTQLVAEVNVAPKDVGLIRRGGSVRMLVDAFNYTEWGVITGTVTDISGDIREANGTPVFLVRCALDRSHLALRNGVRGELRKGMSFRARFAVAERSLFQLLYDDVDAWVNPTRVGSGRS